MADKIVGTIHKSATNLIHKNINKQPPKINYGSAGITKQGAFTEVLAKPRITTGSNNPGSHIKESPNSLGKMHAHKSTSGGAHVSSG